jgi:hypothetical protein
MQPLAPDVRRERRAASSWAFLGIAVVLGAVVLVGAAAVVVVAVHATGLLPLLGFVCLGGAALVARTLHLARQRRAGDPTGGRLLVGGQD